jgi:hypothetical protein
VALLSRWLVRIGAFLLLLSPLLPQILLPGRTLSPVQVLREGSPTGSPVEWLGLVAWLGVPVAAGAALLAGVWRRTEPGPALRGLTLALLLSVAFATATTGSIVLTETGSGASARAPSFPLALLMFLLPLVLGGTALARLVGGDFARSSGGFARLSLGLLLALNGLFLVDAGWDLVLPLLHFAGAPHPGPGAWVAPVGGLGVAAGELLARLRPRAAVDTAPASS